MDPDMDPEMLAALAAMMKGADPTSMLAGMSEAMAAANDLPREVFDSFDAEKWVGELRAARAAAGGLTPLDICGICCEHPLTQNNQMRMYCCGQIHCKICLFSSGKAQEWNGKCAFCRKPWPQTVQEARKLLSKHNEAWAKYELATQVWPQGHVPFVGSLTQKTTLLRASAEAGFAPAQSELAGLEFLQGSHQTAESVKGRDEAQRLLVLASATGEPEACYELFKFVVVHAGPPEYLTTARTMPRQAGHRDKAVYKHALFSVQGLALHFLADTADGMGMPVAAAKEAMALLHLAASRHLVKANEILLAIYDICQKRGDPLGVAPKVTDMPGLAMQLDRAVLLHNGMKTAKPCHCCGRETSTWAVCGRCKRAKYCSKECQRADWRKHKSCCLPAPKSDKSAAKSDPPGKQAATS